MRPRWWYRGEKEQKFTEEVLKQNIVFYQGP